MTFFYYLEFIAHYKPSLIMGLFLNFSWMQSRFQFPNSCNKKPGKLILRKTLHFERNSLETRYLFGGFFPSTNASFFKPINLYFFYKILFVKEIPVKNL
jgi:hypothetical protein